MQFEGAREPRGARRGQTGWPKKGPKAERSARALPPGRCALAAAAPGEGALQKRRLACCAWLPRCATAGALHHGAVRCNRGGAARRSYSTAPCAAARESQHGTVRYSPGGTAQHGAVRYSRGTTARRRALHPRAGWQLIETAGLKLGSGLGLVNHNRHLANGPHG